MSSIKETAEQFFDACETGKGWNGCQTYCHEGATFSSQTGALEGVETVQGYTEWMKGLFTPVPDGSYEVRSFAVDDARQNVAAYGVFRGTHTGEGGPVPPTGKKVEADYVGHGLRRRSNSSPDEDLERRDQPGAAGLDLRTRSPGLMLNGVGAG
jgi:predicted ester cyclase